MSLTLLWIPATIAAQGRAQMLDAARALGFAVARVDLGETTTKAGVLARIAAAMGDDWKPVVDREAVDLGKKGADSVYGRGLLCGKCR